MTQAVDYGRELIKACRHAFAEGLDMGELRLRLDSFIDGFMAAVTGKIELY